MEIDEILEDLKTDLKNAKRGVGDLKELLDLGDEVGISTVTDRAEMREMERQIEKYGKAIDKRLDNIAKKKENEHSES